MKHLVRTRTSRPLGTLCRNAALLAIALLSISPAPATAQIPPEALRLLQSDPEAIRERLLNSGLSNAEIRSRLATLGLDPDILDGFMTAPIGELPVIDGATVEALSALGVVQSTPDGVEIVPVASGMVDGLEVDSVPPAPIFGLNVFSRGSTLFQPLLFGPVPDDYRLGPGDSMVLVLSGEVEFARELTVSRGGFIIVEDAGQIQVTNLTIGELREVLYERLRRVYSALDRGTSTLDISVTDVRTIQVHVSGEVAQPGAFQLSSVATVMNALYAAGGVIETSGLRNVRVSRRGADDVWVDLYPYLLFGDASQDVGLEQGDVVFVGLKERRVAMTGAVERAAEYELSEDEELLDALQAAGGFASNASRDRLAVHRVVLPGDRGPGLTERSVFDLELIPSSDPTHPRWLDGVLVPHFGLQDGDSIVIDESPALEDGFYVSISGRVAQPGMVPWREGLTLRELMLLARGPIVGADLRFAQISRLPVDRTDGALAELLSVPMDSSYLTQRDGDGRYVGPPGVPFDPPGSAPEYVLQPYDHVAIQQQPDFEMHHTVMISGEVPVPGEYALASKSDGVVDLIERAGGILATGYAGGARLIRAEDRLGRIDMDLPAALADPGSDDNITLQPGDSIHIPVYSPTVRVNGAVNSPVTVLYQQGENFDYYIANAGGYRHDADKGRINVRYANGQAETRSKFLLWASYPTPGPGSIITVPAKDPELRLDSRGLIADLVAITGSIATMVIVITR